jgi:hypothetical protein
LLYRRDVSRDRSHARWMILRTIERAVDRDHEVVVALSPKNEPGSLRH